MMYRDENGRVPDDWVRERIKNVFHDMLDLQEGLQQPYRSLEEITPWGEKLRDHLLGQIYSAYHDLTKLLSFAYGAENWDVNDRQKLVTEGEAGFKLLLEKYKYGAICCDDRKQGNDQKS